MKVLESIGRCAMSVNRLLVSLVFLITGAGAQAAPVDPLTDAIANALATAKGAWTESLLQPAEHTSAYDEQIFTELSPILDGLESIKLPEDQLLTD